MFCCKCGAEITEDTRYCPRCGASVDDGDVAKRNRKRAQIGKKHIVKSTKKVGGRNVLKGVVIFLVIWMIISGSVIGLCYKFISDFIEFAASEHYYEDFHAEKQVVCVRRGRRVTLPVYISTADGKHRVNCDCDNNFVTFDWDGKFDDDGNADLKIYGNIWGYTVLTFSNNVNRDEFKVFVVVY